MYHHGNDLFDEKFQTHTWQISNDLHYIVCFICGIKAFEFKNSDNLCKWYYIDFIGNVNNLISHSCKEYLMLQILE